MTKTQIMQLLAARAHRSSHRAPCSTSRPLPRTPATQRHRRPCDR
jgi:hypothetical protein